MVGDFDTNMDMEVDIYPYPNNIMRGNFKILGPKFQLSNIKAK